MTVRGLIFGHRAYYDQEEEAWRWEDGGGFTEEEPKACPQCGQHRTEEGYDPCIGFIEGANSVCCGHGKVDGWVGWKE